MTLQAEKNHMRAFGRRLRTLRESKRLTQEEFARRCGISVSYTSLLERGERNPSYEMMLTVARSLEVPVADLFREGGTLDTLDVSQARLLDFARKAHLSRQQVERFVAVGRAMFGIEPENIEESQRCIVEGCNRPVLARALCAPH